MMMIVVIVRWSFIEQKAFEIEFVIQEIFYYNTKIIIMALNVL